MFVSRPLRWVFGAAYACTGMAGKLAASVLKALIGWPDKESSRVVDRLAEGRNWLLSGAAVRRWGVVEVEDGCVALVVARSWFKLEACRAAGEERSVAR